MGSHTPWGLTMNLYFIAFGPRGPVMKVVPGFALVIIPNFPLGLP